MEILNFEDLGDTEYRLAANAVVLVLEEYHISIATYLTGVSTLISTGLKATWWPGSGLDTYRRDWTTKVIVHVYQRFLEGYYH